MHIKVVIWALLYSAFIRRCDGGWLSQGTTPDGAIDFSPDDPKDDLEQEPPPPSTIAPTTTTTTPTTTTTTTPTTTTTTSTTTTTTTPTTTTTTPTTTTTTTPTTTTTTPTTTTTTTPTTTTTTPTTTTTTTPTTTTTTPTTTTTTPTTTTTTTPTTTTTTPTTTTTTTPTTTTTTPTTTTTTTPTTTTTTPTTTTTTTPTTNTTTKPPPLKDCAIELDAACLEPKQLLWTLPDTKEFLIFRIRLRNALILDKQAKLFMLHIPDNDQDGDDAKCMLDTSNGSERHVCPFERKTLLGFWRSWNELCVVVFPKLQNVTYANCERRVDCCGAGTRCSAAGFVRNTYLIYCDRYYHYFHSFIDGRTPDVIKSDLLIHGDSSRTDIPSNELESDSQTYLGEFFIRHDLFPQGCNCLIRSCKRVRYGMK